MQARVERWYERLSLWRAVGTVVAVALTLVLIAGALARIVEPETFTSLGVAYWWALVTIATVGYGDVVPESPAGRIVGSMLILSALAFIPTLTSVIVSALISKRSQPYQERMEQLEAEQGAALRRIEERLERIERAR